MVAVNVIDPAGPGLVGIGAETGQSSGAFVFDTGDNTQASFITPLSEAGTLNANSWAATDLTIDVIGYFTAPTRTYRYTYDTTGLRASKSLDDEGVTGQGWSKEFTWDTSGGLPLLLAEHRGSQTSYVVYGPQGTPIYQVTATGDVMYFHQDHLGSIRLVTNANGTTKGTLTYNAYGKIKTNTIGWLQEQPLLGYNSQYHDPETGYIYLRARHYDPTTSQFTTVDPLVAVTEEPYGYVGGDPENGVDPSGLCLGLGDGPCTPKGIIDDGLKTIEDSVPDCIAGRPKCDSLVSRATKGRVCSARYDEDCDAIKDADPWTGNASMALLIGSLEVATLGFIGAPIAVLAGCGAGWSAFGLESIVSATTDRVPPEHKTATESWKHGAVESLVLAAIFGLFDI